jgi:hypothetical protein
MTCQELAVVERLQEWYRAQCDGEWEHTHGIRIDTLDNPGWALEIDLNDTELASKKFEEIDFSTDVKWDWYRCRIKDAKFQAFCGPSRLVDVIAIFSAWAFPTSDYGDRL